MTSRSLRQNERYPVSLVDDLQKEDSLCTDTLQKEEPVKSETMSYEGIQIFARLHGQDNGLLPIEVPPSATVQGVIDQIATMKSIPKYSTLSYQGKQCKVNDTLAECGVGRESVVEITPIPPKPDIEKLFDLFDDPADSLEVFGYENYFDFRDAEPLRSNKNHHFRNTLVKVEFTERGHGDFVNYISICGAEEFPLQLPSWNWDILEQFVELANFKITRANIGRVVPFGKLPRSLKFVDLCENQFDQMLVDSDLKALPPTLEELDLDLYPFGAQFKGVIKRSAFPQTLWRVSKGFLLTVN